MAKKSTDILTIGELARRTGLSVSAIRFYETKGIVTPHRNAGGQRRFLRSDIRRLSFLLIAQRLGFSIDEIRSLFDRLPNGRTPTARDWNKLSRVFQARLDDQIQTLQRTREKLDGCIGCGCLSLKHCALYNPDDEAGSRGAGPQLVFRDGAETE